MNNPAAPHSPPGIGDFLRTERGAALVIFAISFAIRLAHNSFIMASPLHFTPLGGHVQYLLMAREITAHGLLPWERAFSDNSPLYPYLLALQYQLAGGESFLAVRLFGMAADSITCALVSLMAFRHFGILAAYTAGVLAAGYGPMMFYSAELIAAVYSVFFLTLGIFLLDRDGGLPRHLASGIFIGLAAAALPNLVLAAALAATAPAVLGRSAWRAKGAAVATGAILAISPITAANYLVSGEFVPLTLSGGHNFYLGHNPQSTAGYTPPLEGSRMGIDIFARMKQLAEAETGGTMKDTEVSGYYFSKALANIAGDPVGEASLLVKKAAAAVNHHEATTYVDYYFQKGLSPILAWAPGMGLLFPLAAMGMAARGRGRYVLFIPIIATMTTIALFFFISRLRIPMAPFLIVFAAGAVSILSESAKNGEWAKIGRAAAFMAPLFILSGWDFVRHDSSNEWNKVGVVLKSSGRDREAEAAFFRAARENPANADTYLNLALLYEKNGAPGKAGEMRERARRLTGGGSK